MLEFSINNTVNESTGYSPFYLDMGRIPMTPGLVNVPADSDAVHSDPVAFVQAHQEVLTIARDALLEARVRAANDAARSVREPGYAIGDEVMLATRTFQKGKLGKKLRKRWEGPYRVVRVYKNGVEIDLSTSPHTRLSTLWSNAFVKRYQRAEQEDPAPAGAVDAPAPRPAREDAAHERASSSRERDLSDDDSSDEPGECQFQRPERLERPERPPRHSARVTRPTPRLRSSDLVRTERAPHAAPPPVVLDHYRHQGSYWYHVRFHPHEPPELISRVQALERCPDELYAYEGNLALRDIPTH